MRTALLISGLIRPNFKNCFETINKYFIQLLNPDIFISSWDSKDVDEVLRLYKPIYSRIEDYNDTSIKMRINNFLYFMESINYDIRENIIKSGYPMYYKIYDVNCLKRDYEIIKDFKYDLVIRLRFDLNFEFDINNLIIDNNFPKCFGIDNEEILDVLQNDLVYLRLDPFYGKFKKFNEWIWDNFAFGNSKMMDIYSNTFINIEKMILLNKENLYINEMILLHHLKENNVILKHTKTFYEINRNTK
jgi:hypothetical protein